MIFLRNKGCNKDPYHVQWCSTRDLFIAKLDNVRFAFLKQQCYSTWDPLTGTIQQTARYSSMTTKAQKLRVSIWAVLQQPKYVIIFLVWTCFSFHLAKGSVHIGLEI